MKQIKVELIGLVCDDCTIAITNNDFTGMDNITEEQVKTGLKKLFTRNTYATIGDNVGFSHIQCQCCGSRLDGNRHELKLLSNEVL